MVRTAWLLLMLGCGRIGFATTNGLGDDGGGDQDGGRTGSAGARYLIELDTNATGPTIAGAQGRVAVLEGFQGAITIASTALTGQAMFSSSGLVWLDPSGVATTSSVLDSTSICQIRTLGTANGPGVLAAGLANASTTTPALGPCAIATSRQDGISIAIDPTGAQSLVADVQSGSFNIQTWFATGMTDGSVALSGVYGGSGKLGTMALPVAGSDENSFYARVDPVTHDARWVATVNSPADFGGGPIDGSGDDVCAIGEFTGTMTVFGTQLTAVGGSDAWVARLDTNGTPRFVRGLGSIAVETTSFATIAATSDGACTVALPVANDLAIDSLVLPASGGSSVIVRFDATGVATAGARLDGLQVARLGDQIYGAYTTGVGDIAIAKFDAALHATMIAELTGGATQLEELAPIPPDALGIAFEATTTQTTFGALTLTPTAEANALALLGL